MLYKGPHVAHSNIRIKGGYLGLSHFCELKKYISLKKQCFYMKKQYKSSIIKNHKITNKKNDGVPLQGYAASEVIFRFRAKNKKKSLVGISSD